MPKSKRKKLKKMLRDSWNIENPAVPISLFSDEAAEVFGGGRTMSGVRVTRHRALGYPAVWRAVSLISGDLGRLPLMVYRQSGKNRDPDPTHPAYRLLLRKPNNSMTAFIFKQTLGVNVLLEGNAYAYIDRDGMGRPVALLWLDPTPGRMTVILIDGELWYCYKTPVSGEVRKLPAADVLHIKGMGFDGLQGYPVLKIAGGFGGSNRSPRLLGAVFSQRRKAGRPDFAPR